MKSLVVFIALFCYVERGDSTTASPCGGTLTAPKDKMYPLESPDYPNITTVNETCVWKIKSFSDSYVVSLVIADLGIEGGIGCPSGSVTVYDGPESPDLLLATWCGDRKPLFRTSSGRDITVVYTVFSKNGRGFKALVKSIQSSRACTVLTAEDNYSYLDSPRYPQTYPKQYCAYSFYASHGQIKIEFLSVDLPPRIDGKCSSDYLIAYTDLYSNLQLPSINTRKSRACGTELPVYISPGLRLKLALRTFVDQSGNYTGFRLRYIQGNFSNEYIPPWGGDLTANTSVQTFTSPNYPDNYPSGHTWTWTIHTEDRTQNVRVVGYNVSLYSSYPGFCDDTLKIFDGASTANRITTLCGFNPTLFQQSVSNAMTLVLETIYGAPGFILHYTQTKANPPCNYNYTAPEYTTKFASSQGFPIQYRTNDRCTWLIEKSDGSNLDVIFVVTNISTSCSTDYVSVYDGNSNSSRLLGRFCGGKTPTFSTRGHSLLIEFTSGPTVHGAGLKFKYVTNNRAPCQPVLKFPTRHAEYLTSTNYPSMYPRNAECTWQLSCYAFNSKIVLDVLMSDIEESPKCVNDWVAVYDGSSKIGQLLGKWCGSKTPTFTASGDSLFIVLHSNDNDITGKGFRMKYNYEDRIHYPNYTAIILGSLGGVFSVGITTAAVLLLRRKKLQGPHFQFQQFSQSNCKS